MMEGWIDYDKPLFFSGLLEETFALKVRNPAGQEFTLWHNDEISPSSQQFTLAFFSFMIHFTSPCLFGKQLWSKMILLQTKLCREQALSHCNLHQKIHSPGVVFQLDNITLMNILPVGPTNAKYSMIESSYRHDCLDWMNYSQEQEVHQAQN
jgi:hypothetical protein